MLTYYVARKSDQSFIEFADNESFVDGWRKDDTEGAGLARLKLHIPTNYGGAKDDYTYYKMSDQQVKRKEKKHSFEVVWTGDEVTALDFTSEDDKRILKAKVLGAKGGADKRRLIADGVDSIFIRLELHKKDDSGIAKGFSGNRDVGILRGGRVRVVNVSFVDGVAERTFKTADPQDVMPLAVPWKVGENDAFQINDAPIEVKVVAPDSTLFWG